MKILTDVFDDSLYKDASNYLYREYMVRNDLLVCPRLYPENSVDKTKEWWEKGRVTKLKHKLYLPQPDSWFVFNLRPDHIEDPDGDTLKIDRRTKLGEKFQGGAFTEWDDEIRFGDNEHIPYVMPMFIREGRCSQSSPRHLQVITPWGNLQVPSSRRLNSGSLFPT
jgi:hypothetical protein